MYFPFLPSAELLFILQNPAPTTFLPSIFTASDIPPVLGASRWSSPELMELEMFVSSADSSTGSP